MRQVALLVAVVCVLAAPVVAAADPTSGQAARTLDLQESPDQEGVDITIQLQPDGDARWNISARYALETANDSAAFARLAEQFKAGETNTGFSVGVFESVVSSVSDEVGRPMQIRATNPRTAKTIDHGNNSTGVLSIQFTWTNFSRVEGERFVVDSFTGTWFGDLEPGQTLTIQPPSGFEPEQVRPEATVVNGGYQWTGPQNFESGQPSVVFTDDGLQEQPFATSLLTLLGVGALALVVGGILVWAYQYSGDAGRSSTDDQLPNNSSSPNGGTTPEAAATAGSSDDSASGGGAAVDSELLSDEERVEQLLADNGGRMKQAKIVDETRWSNAKVSQLLSSMADDGRVEKLRIGRENLISLPGEGVNDEEHADE
ncbi:helix-turn-helix transcriptional regulator [Halobacterium zhouii]|uniref:helix-turn-helix transcriptional regulator n=1 Tax=Halobacterium zhouii TaxID=2902624 RepID=UPI001E5B8989|nr:hypothetical protein [Halobacterium zhouii]